MTFCQLSTHTKRLARKTTSCQEDCIITCRYTNHMYLLTIYFAEQENLSSEFKRLSVNAWVVYMATSQSQLDQKVLS